MKGKPSGIRFQRLNQGLYAYFFMFIGLTKMAEVCPGSTKSSLEDIQAWYIRDETY
ncbi:hypothetical protein [Lelliottia amnigena]|uniref:hypothetical protein n=1 Tax=Lelliottia amnigena TaxID=61646 RepID=UPI0040559E1A